MSHEESRRRFCPRACAYRSFELIVLLRLSFFCAIIYLLRTACNKYGFAFLLLFAWYSALPWTKPSGNASNTTRLEITDD